VDKQKDMEYMDEVILTCLTQGCETPVPMDVYDITLPLMYSAAFTDALKTSSSLKEAVMKADSADEDFPEEVFAAKNEDDERASRALGVALLRRHITFGFEGDVLTGNPGPVKSDSLPLAEKLGTFITGMSAGDIEELLTARQPVIVVLQRESLGDDIDWSALEGLGQVTYHDHTRDDEVIDLCKEADVILTNKNHITADIMDACENLRFIGEMATGYNNIDIDAARERDITVCNVPAYSTDAVVQLTFAMALELLTNVSGYRSYVASGAYAAQEGFSYFGYPMCELSSLTWGVVGLGHIGKKVYDIAKAFGAKCVYASTTGAHEEEGYDCVPLEVLASSCDIISIHAPLNDNTRNLFDAETLSLMKPGAILINVARGGIVDEEALTKALNEGTIGGAALDVFSSEPLPETSALYNADPDKIIMTPHCAWASAQARGRLAGETIANVKAFLEGEPRNVVNDAS